MSNTDHPLHGVEPTDEPPRVHGHTVEERHVSPQPVPGTDMGPGEHAADDTITPGSARATAAEDPTAVGDPGLIGG